MKQAGVLESEVIFLYGLWQTAKRALRGGAALVIAGAMAQGETIIENRHFIERGYEDITRDLRELGVTVFTE